MYSLRALSLVIIVVTLFSSCRKDEFVETPSEPKPIDTEVETIIEADVNGFIKDQDNAPIADARVLIGNELALTDANGVFRIPNVDLYNSGSLIKIQKDGFYEGFKFTNGWPGSNSYLEAILIKKEVRSFISNEDVTIDLTGGASVSFSSNSLVNSNGQIYDGLVTINGHYFDPRTTDLSISMPGDLRAINANDEKVQLVTHGMMNVELYGDSGEELKLMDGKTATLNFPIPNGSSILNESTIPTWHLDESNGFWIEEGVGQIMTNEIVAEVSHFSSWNCDVPFPYVELEGRLIDEDQIAYSNQAIVFQDETNNLTSNGYTDNEGRFRRRVPIDVDLTLSILSCDELVEIFDIGILQENTVLDDIIIDQFPKVEINAILVDCDSNVIDDGYVTIKNDFETKLTLVEDEGEILYVLPICDGEEYVLKAHDRVNSYSSETITLDVTNGPVNLDTIKVCDLMSSTFNCEIEVLCCPTNGFTIYFLDGVPPYSVQVTDGTGDQVYDDVINSSFEDIFLDNGIWYSVFVEDASGATCNSSIEVSEYLNTIKGKVWIDDQSNGLINQYDVDDTPYKNLIITLINQFDETVAITESDEFGNYTIKNVEGNDYRIEVDAPSGLEFVELGEIAVEIDSHVDEDTGISVSVSVGDFDFDKDYTLNVRLK